MRKLISLLFAAAMLLSLGISAGADSGNTQVISCPEQDFSLLCDEAYKWDYTQRNGITIYTEKENSIPYVIVYRLEDWLVDVGDFMHEQYTPHIQQQYGDDLVSFTEYQKYTIGGREMPAALYSYRLQGYVIDMLRGFDTQDGHTVYFTAKYIQGKGEETLKALDLAVESYRPDPDYYSSLSEPETAPAGRWSFTTEKTASGDIRYQFEEVEIVVPGSWEGNVETKVNDFSVSFYQSASRKLWKENFGFEGGLLFSLGYAETDDYRDYLPSFADLGKGAEGYYYLIFPTDYQGYEQDQAARKEYSEMYADIGFVREHSASLVEPAPKAAPAPHSAPVPADDPFRDRKAGKA